jgi:hypothetical protein
VSSFRGANTLFERQQTQRRDTDRRENTEKKNKKTQLKEDPSSRSKEEPEPLRDAKSEGHNAL